MTGTDPTKAVAISALGQRLRRLRAAYGATIREPDLSRAAMSRLLGVEQERYRTYERGQREPPLWILLRIKHLTGFSIDTLLTGAVCSTDYPIFENDVEGYEQSQMMAQRMRWVRQLQEPDIEKAAALLGVRLDTWQRWELGLEQPNLRKLAEFAGRFNVSLDFLYSGRLVGVERDLEAALVALHPELRRSDILIGETAYSRTARSGDGNSDRSDDWGPR